MDTLRSLRPSRVATEKKAAPVRCQSLAAGSVCRACWGHLQAIVPSETDVTNLEKLPEHRPTLMSLTVTLTRVRGPQGNVDQIKELLRKRAELKVSSKDTGVAEALRFWLLTCLFCHPPLAALAAHSLILPFPRAIHYPKCDDSRAALLTDPKLRRKLWHLLNGREAQKMQKPNPLGSLECQARARTQMSGTRQHRICGRLWNCSARARTRCAF